MDDKKRGKVSKTLFTALGLMIVYVLITQFGFRQVALVVLSAVVLFVIALGILLVFRGQDKGLKKLNLDCDPKGAIAINQRQIAKLEAKNNPRFRTALTNARNNLAVAQFADGNIPTAIAMLEEQGTSVDSSMMKVVNHSNLAELYWEWEKTGNFLKQAEMVEELIEKLAPGEKQQLSEVLSNLQIKKDILDGKLEEGRDFYLAALDRIPPKQRRARAVTMNNLARIYGKLGQEEERRAMLEQVAQVGNDLDIARKAREELGL